MRRKKRIPDKPRYATITRKAYQLLAELEIAKFPVDPFEIIEQLDSLYLAAWTELKENTGVSDPAGLKVRKLDAETIVKRGSGEYLIVYDDTIGYLPRIRFTLAHEIGHIIMGHFTEFEKTSLREGVTPAEKVVLEREADAVTRSDRKSVAIVIGSDGSVFVRAPKAMPDAEISAFVNKKRMWIRAKQEQIAAISEKHESLHADDGDSILYLGHSCVISKENTDEIIIDGDTLIVPLNSTIEDISAWLKDEAGKVIQERVDRYASIMGVKYASV